MALTGSTDEQKIWNYLKAQGLSDSGTAGLMGNLYAESGLQPKNLQNTYEKKLGYTDETYTAAVDNGTYSNFAKDSAGYGLAQWTYCTRKKKLLAYAKEKRKSIGDLEMQLSFLIKELSEDYAIVLKTLETTNNVTTASNEVLTKFERPANVGVTVQKKRAAYGQTYYNKYTGKAGISTMATNITEYAYSTNKQLSAHFNATEFRCKCGKQHSTKISNGLVEKLEKLYSKLNCSKIIVNSGYRCTSHDKAVGGNGSGQHTKGTAADVVCYDKNGKPISAKIVSCVAQDLGFTGIGNITKAYQAIHLDVRSGSKWYGNEVVNNNTVTSDFYSYYGISKADVSKYTGENSSTVTSSKSSKTSSVEAAKSYRKDISGTYKVTASSLNVRTGAGTNKAIVTTIASGTKVQNYGYYTEVSGIKWLYIQFQKDGKTYTGFASGQYLSKA